jgi:sporulation protein YlmC with PRC-barrel domain
MRSKHLAAILLSTALMTGVASAQTTTTTTTERATTTMMHKDGQWRSSKLIGVDVYNDAKEKIGDIEELIVDKSGKIEHVVLGVGGFLGMGEHYVAVSFDKLKFVTEAVRSTSASSAPTTTTEKTTTGTTATTTTTTIKPVRAANEQWYPDHAVFNATKDQLKAMPQFKYN